MTFDYLKIIDTMKNPATGAGFARRLFCADAHAACITFLGGDLYLGIATRASVSQSLCLVEVREQKPETLL